jgi:hypothetical protein
MADEDEGAPIVLMAVGAAVIFIALFLPLLVVRYAPPGGSAVLYGHTVNAFADTITGWQFATTAQYSHILPALLALLVLGVLRLARRIWFEDVSPAPMQYVHALAHVVVSIGWLLLLAFAVLVGTESMPTDGEKGILPAFQANPFSPASPQSLNPPVTPYLSAGLEIGWFLLLIGIAIGAFVIWKKVAAIAVALIVVLIILRFADHSLFVWFTNWLGF